jgi:hypothetical protein
VPPPIETIDFQADGLGYLQFQTNDPSFYDKSFIHIPALPENSFAKDAPWSVSVDVIKVWGSQLTGCGMVFAYKGPGDYLALVVAAKGGYNIMQCVSGTLVDVSGWTTFSSVNSYNSVNTLSVSFVPDAGGPDGPHFLLSINGKDLGSKLKYPPSQTTQAGFYAWIGDSAHEYFPYATSDQRYKMTIGTVAYP